MSNHHVSLEQLSQMTAEQISLLSVEQMATLREDLDDRKASIKHLEDLLNTGIALAYHSRAEDMRRAAGKNTGTVSIDLGDWVVRADSPKKVDWNQDILKKAMETVQSWGENPADYLNMVLSVPEARFNAWPPAIRAVFEPARTVSSGRPTFKLERSKKKGA